MNISFLVYLLPALVVRLPDTALSPHLGQGITRLGLRAITSNHAHCIWHQSQLPWLLLSSYSCNHWLVVAIPIGDAIGASRGASTCSIIAIPMDDTTGASYGAAKHVATTMMLLLSSIAMPPLVLQLLPPWAMQDWWTIRHHGVDSPWPLYIAEKHRNLRENFAQLLHRSFKWLENWTKARSKPKKSRTQKDLARTFQSWDLSTSKAELYQNRPKTKNHGF